MDAMRFFLAVLLCLALHPAAQAACVIRQRATIALEVVGGTIMAPVEINGMAATMILDTGAGRSVVTREAVRRLGLELDEWVGTTMRGVGGVERHRNANPRSLVFGGVALQRRTTTRDTSLTVGTLPRASTPHRVIDGLLGRDFLSVFDLVLDMPGRSVTLYDVQGCVGRFPPWSGEFTAIKLDNPTDTALVAPVDIDGKRLRALLDTGASASLIAAPGMYRLGLTEAMLADDPVNTISGLGPNVLTMRRHRFTRMLVGNQALEAPAIWVAPVRLNPIVDMLLGADWLAGRKVWISFATHQLFVAER